MTYTAPLADMRFVLDEMAGFGEVARLPGYEAAEPDLVDAVLGEAAKFAASVLAPLNQRPTAPAASSKTASCARPGVSRGLCAAMSRAAGTASPPIRNMAARACRWRSPHRSRRCGTRPA